MGEIRGGLFSALKKEKKNFKLFSNEGLKKFFFFLSGERYLYLSSRPKAKKKNFLIACAKKRICFDCKIIPPSTFFFRVSKNLLELN